MLWTATVYLYKTKGASWYLITLLPALFMTAVCVSFILVDKTGFRLPQTLAPWIGLGTFVLSAILFYAWKARHASDKQVVDKQ